MNKGLLPGLNQDGWRNYPLTVKTIGADPSSGNTVQPTLGYTTTSNFARYLIVDHQYVVVEVMVSFLTYPGLGLAYVIKLPFPANRWTGTGQPSAVPLSTTPGMAYWSFSNPWVTMPLIATLADPHVDLGSSEDHYFQMYCPRQFNYGATVESGGHKLVSAVAGVPLTLVASDIDITPTDASGILSTSGLPSIQNLLVTPNNFDVVNSAGGAGAAHFSWKWNGNPPSGQYGAIVSPGVPWDWTPAGSFGITGNIFLQLSYEPKF